MIEAVVAHYEATGKTNFLDMAKKTGDLISRTFGPDRLRLIPGHQEIELALAKLYSVTGETEYIEASNRLWDNATGKKIYLTGGVGASHTGQYVNLFMASESKIDFRGKEMTVNQVTEYPWDGEVKIRLGMDVPASFTVRIRVPGWAREEAIPLGLYRYMNSLANAVTLKVNGKDQPIELDKGYAVIRKKWQSGDEITLSLPMEVRRVLSDERVKENNGRVSLERGPLVFCAEGIDYNGKTENIILPDDSKLTSRYVRNLIGGITVIEGKAKTTDTNGRTFLSDFTAIPYFAWLNRGNGEMDIWLPREEVKRN